MSTSPLILFFGASKRKVTFRGLARIPLIVAAVAIFSACSENPVGRRCFIGDNIDSDGAGNSMQSIIASPALECQSRQCLRISLDTNKEDIEDSEYTDLCTAECSSSDDCDKVPESPCVSGFTCAVAVQTGPFCCRKMCICKDYVVVPDGGIPAPAACDPENEANRCVNLSGR